ncbi:MAG: hypothetical protein XE13_1063, partial [Proteiniphilum sp. 51_7]
GEITATTVRDGGPVTGDVLSLEAVGSAGELTVTILQDWGDGNDTVLVKPFLREGTVDGDRHLVAHRFQW